MKKYIKPTVDVVEISFNGSIAALTPSGDIFGSGIAGSSSDAGINLFSDPNGTKSSNATGNPIINNEGTENE